MPIKYRVTWPAVPAEAQITRYDVEVTVGSNVLQPVAVPANVTQYDFNNPPTTQFSARVRAVNVRGEGPWSNVASGPANPPPAPGDPTVTTIVE